jgi:hypothetical protein
MNGKIHAYSTAVSAGLINGTDGNRYSFASREWDGAKTPVNQQAVTFTVKGGHAYAVKMAPAA